jgi:hypothetical protein
MQSEVVEFTGNPHAAPKRLKSRSQPRGAVGQLVEKQLA